jgi:hypothetical protein
VALLTPVFWSSSLWPGSKPRCGVTPGRKLGSWPATPRRWWRRSGVAPADARASVLRVLADDTDLRSVSVAVDRTPEQVMVRIEGTAPGILRGTRAPVRVAVVVPTEGWRP